MYGVYYEGSSAGVESTFFSELGVANESDARDAVYDLCGSAQAAMDQM